MATRNKKASPDLPPIEDPEERNASDALVVVGIGASAGGLKVLEEFFGSLPETSNMAFVVVVHLSPEHDSSLADLLQQHTKMPVAQVADHVRVEADHVYVIPPGNNLSMTDGHIDLTERSRPNHLPIDLFFRTLAESHGAQSVAVILSGTASDGSLGIGRIHERGGLTIAQSPDEAEYDAMPQAAIATGHVDRILRVAELAAALQEYQRRLERTTRPLQSDSHHEADAALFASIFEHLNELTSHDFTHYKRATIRRRLTRRMNVTETEDLAEYLDYLQKHPEETNHLLKDLLLTVTNFFRDPDAFAALEKDVIPKLFEEKESGEPVRAWTCGCATGEEAYSIAMLLVEEAERISSTTPSQVFASDISDEALSVARAGHYSGAIASDVSPERLRRFFQNEAGGYRIKKDVRALIVFAAHNFLHDPPFSRLDLIVCRNLLIYLDRSVHGHILELFHYSLLPGGFLFLGESESVDNQDLFTAVDDQKGLYRRRDVTSVIRPSISMPSTALNKVPTRQPDKRRATEESDIETLHHSLVSRYAPASLIVSPDYEIVHSLGGGEEYLKFRSGRPTQNVFKVVREELRLELRTALYQAFRKVASTRTRAIPVRVEGGLRHVELTVEPISEAGYPNDHVHVVIRDAAIPSRPPADPGSEASSNGELVAPAADAVDPRTSDQAKGYVRRLEEELDRVKEQLQSATKEHEVANEEMAASNEEMQSINEELQSINEELTSTTEELKTSKTEVQSANKKLLELNADLEAKMDEVNRINADLRNLMDATEIATIFVDRNLHVKRYTPQVRELFEMGDTGVGRRLIDLSHQLNMDDFAADAARVLRDHIMVEREVQHSKSELWFLVRSRPYRGIGGTVDGVVITFVDITQKKQHDEQLEALVATLEHLLSARADQIKRLASELLIAEQTERQRIAQILHDELQQLLYAFKMRIGSITRTLSKDQALRLSQATELIDRAMDVTRTLTVELSPRALNSEDVGATLEGLALRMDEMHNLQVDVTSAAIRLPSELRTLVYLTARELLFNVVKHAGTDRARLNLVQIDNQLVLTVEDEGAGFDVPAEATPGSKKQGGFGLEGVRQRLDHFGGRLDMDAVPGEGTRATLFLPLGDDATVREPADVLEEASERGAY